MRVIAGIYRSRPLVAPRGLATRPTTDRLRETLFNVLSPRIEGSTFADLYAGSGANGIEALSRGARHVYFVEKERAALAAIHSNLKTLGIAAGFGMEARSVAAFLSQTTDARRKQEAAHLTLPSGSRSYSVAGPLSVPLDIVFLDPPYEELDAYAATLNLLGGECAEVLSLGALVVAEHRHKQQLDQRYRRLERTRVLKQGDSALSFYSLDAPAQ